MRPDLITVLEFILVGKTSLAHKTVELLGDQSAQEMRHVDYHLSNSHGHGQDSICLKPQSSGARQGHPTVPPCLFVFKARVVYKKGALGAASATD